MTSLCPCSKEIAEYGAHNQRSTITIGVRPREPIRVGELLRVAENEASSELYGILKRADEKYLTERAYDNPRFVEDLVRGVAARLAADPRVGRLRGRGRELRVDPQPFGLRAHRAGHGSGAGFRILTRPGVDSRVRFADPARGGPGVRFGT